MTDNISKSWDYFFKGQYEEAYQLVKMIFN